MSERGEGDHLLPQLERLLRRILTLETPLIELWGWPGSGKSAVLQALLARCGKNGVGLALCDLASEDALRAALPAAGDAGEARWLVASGEPCHAVHAAAHWLKPAQHLVFASTRRPLTPPFSDSLVSPQEMLLTLRETVALWVLLCGREPSPAAARALWEASDGWYRPLRLALEATAGEGLGALGAEQLLAIPPVRFFLRHEVLDTYDGAERELLLAAPAERPSCEDGEAASPQWEGWRLAEERGFWVEGGERDRLPRLLAAFLERERGRRQRAPAAAAADTASEADAPVGTPVAKVVRPGAAIDRKDFEGLEGPEELEAPEGRERCNEGQKRRGLERSKWREGRDQRDGPNQRDGREQTPAGLARELGLPREAAGRNHAAGAAPASGPAGRFDRPLWPAPASGQAARAAAASAAASRSTRPAAVAGDGAGRAAEAAPEVVAAAAGDRRAAGRLARPPRGAGPARRAPAAPLPVYRLRLLGPPQVQLALGEVERDLGWKLRRSFQVLAYLASSPELEAGREELEEAVWPTEGERTIGRNFHPTLSHLRRALEGEQRGAGPAPLRFENGVYRLNPELQWQVDVHELSRRIDEGRALASRGELAPAAETWRQAWRLYRGPFLQGHYEAWVSARREVYQRLYVELLRDLGDLYLTLERPEEALDAYRSVLLEDPLQERVHLAVMRIYSAQGRRDLVRRQYDRLCTLLRDELDVEPLPRTAQEYLRLMA
ncbi:MAG TPA: BTAD domain-containing putative transcriptional regulator [Thermoanaerobaculia bacterium]|nr:BTAD domain-containing putative transcriptional regulator [Thermoanaerobaculia bacterium]